MELHPSNTTLDRISVFVVDDHPVIADALADILDGEAGMMLCGQACTAAEALEQIGELQPDVAVVDILLGDADGLSLVREIRDHYPDVELLVFSMYDETIYAELALRAGAQGYVMKSAPSYRLVEAVQEVAKGEISLSQRMTRRILSRVARGEDGESHYILSMLSDREISVFHMLGQGHTVREIAGSLHLSHKTVETYRRRAKEKLNLDSVDELVLYAIKWAQARKCPSG